MGTIEQDLLECERGCQSEKITERKKSMDRLTGLLDDHKTISILNKNSSQSKNTNVLTWDDMFHCVHTLLLKQAEKNRTDMQKGMTAAAQTNIENLKLKCSGLIDKLVTKSKGYLKCSAVMDRIIVVLKDGYLRKCYGGTYLLILKTVLSIRNNWGQVQYEYWTELLNQCFLLYETPPPGIDKALMCKILNEIIVCGCGQSHLGLHLRKKFKYLVTAFEDSTLEKLPALQASLLQLSITVSQKLAKESRMATCKFGEDVVKSVIGLYETRLEDRYDKKGLMFDFLLLQMQLHHPNGAREGEGAAYAYNWEKWREQLKSIYALVESEIHNIQKSKAKIHELKGNFLQLAVEICKQVFQDSNNVLDVSNVPAFNESMSYSIAKRRRVVAGIQAIMDTLNQDTWAWMSVLNSLMAKYPQTLKEQEFQQLLRLLAELQSSCKDYIVMGYLCLCCESLLKVERILNRRFLNEKDSTLQWQKIWETTLRTVGLNQCVEYSHQLLQSLIMHNKSIQPSVVIRMYLNGTVQSSKYSLETLEVIFKCCDLPETLEALSNIPSHYSTHHVQLLRCAILDWLLPDKDDIGLTELHLVPFSPQFMSKVLVELIVKSQNGDANNREEEESSKMTTMSSIEEDYMISSFETDLLIGACSKDSGSDNRKNSHSAQLVIPSAKDKLIKLLERDCNILLAREAMPQESHLKQKILTDYISQCMLVSSVLSWFLQWGIITKCELLTFSLTIMLRKLMEKLEVAARGLLVAPRLETKLPVVGIFLQEVRHMFELELHKEVMKLVQQLMPIEVLDAVFNVSITKQSQTKDKSKSSFSGDLDMVDGLMETSSPDIIDEASCSLLDLQLLTEQEKVQLEAVKMLCSYCCTNTGKELSTKSCEGLQKLLSLLMNPTLPDSSIGFFQMAVAVTKKCVNCPKLGDEHVNLILKIIQKLCYARHQDYEAACIILQLLCGIFRHVKDDMSKRNSLILLKAFQKNIKKKYGPETNVQFLKCLGELAKVDPNFVWSNWESGTKLEDYNPAIVSTPVAEELLVHVRNPFHEVRMMAARYICILFSSQIGKDLASAEKLALQKRMFENLFNVITSSFIVEGDLTMEEKVDESANRTASALYCYATLIVISPQWRKKALFTIFRLVKEKNLNTDLVQKVLNVMGRSLTLPGVTSFMEANLNYLLIQFYEMQCTVQDFPCSLFGCTSDSEFYKKYEEFVIPVLLIKEDDRSLQHISTTVGKPVSELVTGCFPRIIACLVPCFVADASDGVGNLDFAKRLYPKLEKLLTKDAINNLLTLNLDKVILNIIRLLYDEQHSAQLFGELKNTISDPDPLHFKFSVIVKSLLYLQENSPKPEVPLVVYMAKELSGHIQKILLCLAIDIHQAPTMEDKLKCLHPYATFVYLLAKEFGADGNGLGKMSTFVVRDVSYTLMHLINLSYQRREIPLAVAVCHFYRLFCSKCFPGCYSVIATFLMVIVNTLVPLTKLDGDLGIESQSLLRFLIVENCEPLEGAIELLDPFPEDDIFREMSEVYIRIKRSKSDDSLEETIKHFLKAGNKNLGCRAEGLKHLHIQLSEKKQELSCLYNELKEMRGFSEDCSRSLLHQLIFMLIELTCVPDSKICLEASRCLGELGPADLTTMILKPEKSQELQDNNFADSPVLMFTFHVVNLLVDYLVDENIAVVEATSAALYKVLTTREGQDVLASKKFNEKYIYPFKMERAVKHDSNIAVIEEYFSAAINENLWCPVEECSHEKWITTLACALLDTFPANCFISQLVGICKVKVSFAEQIIPYLVAVVLSKGTDVCTAVLNRCMCHFFKQHFELCFQGNNEQSTSPKHDNELVCFNRASVQCMLNVVQFVRLQKSLKPTEVSSSPNIKNLDLNYLHVAQASQLCSAYFTSVMYAELWCNEMREKNNLCCVGGQSLSELENIYDKATDVDSLALQNILKQAYKKLGDTDAIYGCGSFDMLNPQSRVHHYELTGNWQNALLCYDIELSSGSKAAVTGMSATLQRLGLHHLLNSFISTETYSEYESCQFECGWRLGRWDLLTTENKRQPAASGEKERRNSQEKIALRGEYEKYHYTSLKALHDSDLSSVEREVIKARQCVINSLTYASLESSKNLYVPLSHLQSLQEIEDFISAKGNIDSVLEKWRNQSQLSTNDFEYVEPILAQRAVLLNNAMLMEKDKNLKEKWRKSLAEIQLGTTKLARKEGWLHVGDRCLRSLLQVELTPTAAIQLKLEEAQLSWERGDFEVGRHIVRNLLTDLKATHMSSEENKLLYSAALQLYGNWMVETKSENPQAIVDRYFIKVQNILESMNHTGESRLEAYMSLARFMDAQYQQLNSLLKSSSFEIKKQYMRKAREEADKLKQQKQRTMDEERKIKMNERTSVIEEKEIENTEKDKDMYLKLALKNYLMSLEHSGVHSLQVFRLTSLWLENTEHRDVSAVMDEHLCHIPSYKFLPVVPQLAPHISNRMDVSFTKQLNDLLERCAVEHPHHTLPVILALANSHKDKDYTGGSNKGVNLEPRVLGAQSMVRHLSNRNEVNSILTQMEAVADALIALAYYDLSQGNKRAPPSSSYQILKKISNQLKGKELVLVPTMTIPVRTNCNYNNIVGIHKYQETFGLVGGINAPKKISCIGTDGIERPQLVKGKDDLRQDAVMQQVFTILNTLLKNNKETMKRKLLIRTYKVVPLSQRSGILEWCQNTQPIAPYLIGSRDSIGAGAHQRYYPNDLTAEQCRKMMARVAHESNEVKLRTYTEICKKFNPVLRYFFLENFPTPGVWFERRLAYIHSVATSSMIGYILGLGDRHLVNILIDNSTAEVIHIDFGIAFEQGHILPTPETVPFRLTRDIEDGMGVSGIEGVFRRCCEKTMSVLRQNQETIITILEVLLYDPLYAWTISPSKAFNMQQRSRKAEVEAYEQETSEEVNKMAERALIRLRQKLQGTEEGTATSISGQVNRLIQQARDPANLCRLFIGWQPYL